MKESSNVSCLIFVNLAGSVEQENDDMGVLVGGVRVWLLLFVELLSESDAAGSHVFKNVVYLFPNGFW